MRYRRYGHRRHRHRHHRQYRCCQLLHLIRPLLARERIKCWRAA
jgi:hypothetical protein